MTNQTKKAIFIDGNSILFRMFYGVRTMANSKGVPTNGVFGFVKLLQQIQNEMRPDYLAVAFDLPQPTFRHQRYDAYKAGRDKMPEELIAQLALIKKILMQMQVPVITRPGYEADDIIGTLAKHFAEKGVSAKIITGDRDSFQLVEDQVHILYTTTRSGSQFVEVDPAYIQEKYGIEPIELIQVKALMGDASDNIPGIKGIGEKTALKFVKQYHTVDGLYEHIDELKGKQKEKVEAGKDAAYLSLFLGEIDVQVPIEMDESDMRMQDLFNELVIETLKELEFTSILRKLSAPTELPADNAASVAYSTVASSKDLYFLLMQIAEEEQLLLHIVQEDESLWAAFELKGRYYYVPETKLVRELLHALNDLPNADALGIVGHDLKSLTHIFEAQGAQLVKMDFDTYVAAYLLEPTDNRYDLKSLAAKYLDQTIVGEEELLGKGRSRKTFGEIAEPERTAYIMGECAAIHGLRTELAHQLDEMAMTDLYQKIELPLIPILASMERIGFKIDQKQLENLSAHFEARIETLTEQIYEEAGQRFNINSTKQLGTILFEEMGLPPIKKTKTGYSTSVEVLEQLRPYNTIVDDILEYRTVTKLDSTYGRGLIKLVDPETEKIHSHFNQTVTATGRISSSDPNLQNIPVRTDLGREIRRVFVPSSPSRVLVDADYSQIELRVLAHLTQDENLIEAFAKNQDIHARTASEIFQVPLEDVTREQRSHAKAINFGLIYGKQAFSLGKELGIGRNQAQDYIDLYFSRYPKVYAYMEGIREEAKTKGYVTTLYGRRRYIPEIQSRNRMLVQSGERMALNTPIQGSAADIMKIAMIKVYHRLAKESFRSHLLLQIHDELIIEAPEAESEKILRLLTEEMENAVSLSVPLVVDAHIGKSWYELK